MPRPLIMLALGLCLPSLAAAQPSRDDGLRALVAGDYSLAAQILRPFAEDANAPDQTAQFMMAILAYTGHGVAGNGIAACALFASAAASRGPFTAPAARLAADLREQMGRAAEFCDEGWRRMAPFTEVRDSRGPPSAAVDGFLALARDDGEQAARETRTIGESDTRNDAAAQFLLATLHESGRGVAMDDLRACALYSRASIAPGSPFGELSRHLMQTLFRQMHDNQWFTKCNVLANLGFDHRFEPASFDVGDGSELSWDFAGAVITHQGTAKAFPFNLAPRGGAYLPLRHTTLYTGRARIRRDFVEVSFWQPAGSRWDLAWHLFEVTPQDLRHVADVPALATSDHRPAASETTDLATLVALRLDEYGFAEWAVVHAGSQQHGTIPSADELRHGRDEEELRRASVDAVDRSRTFDPMRTPLLAYGSADGCGNFELAAFSAERAEAIVVVVDRSALGVPAGTTAVDLSAERAQISIAVHVYDRPVGSSPFCTDVGQTLSEEVWHAVSGRLTIEVSPPGQTARNPALYRATIRLEGAEFVSPSGHRVRQPAPIVLTALAGSFSGW